jgi:hypothetical protein
VSEQQDRLDQTSARIDQIRARRAAVQWSDALAVVPGWQTLHFPRVQDQEFIAHAPDDIDHLLGEVERLRERLRRCQASEFHGMHQEMVRIHGAFDEVERLRGLLAKLEWACQVAPSSVPTCPACRADPGWGHTEDCELAAELRTTP